MLSRWKQPEIVFVIWSILALAILLPVRFLLNSSFPILYIFRIQISHPWGNSPRFLKK
jgi:hypothetical protein